ncbi:WLM [Lasallia pustulata]|uniref:WLM n=1 Tax=Lasallia pustulata TaxID=136370 RepID=A0A1W5DA85_9LECA|nr:WLM [Lasallia pustulata]
MPLGIERLNARRQSPNTRVVFIKPLPGPSAAHAQDFLERIAAICAPIMKAHHLAIMSLEEYEPNPEFVGRNFNAGEVIQLVLKAPFSGHWLPFRSVQMVMMHELAHCVQMNHSGAFWKVRNAFAGELRELWAKGYTGDGMWGRGKTLLSGEYDNNSAFESEIMPRSLCGGTFRSSRRGKRKRKGEGTKKVVSYAERQQRRIAKKFGTNGVTLGDDEDTRVKLEDGRKPKGKPRVAGSARGRELRAAAALARFGQQKEEDAKKEEEGSESETESDYEDVKIKNEAVDLDGSRLLDREGRGMVKVCEDEDQDNVDVKKEMEELQNIDREEGSGPQVAHVKEEEIYTASETEADDEQVTTTTRSKASDPNISTDETDRDPFPSSNPQPLDAMLPASVKAQDIKIACPICSMTNDRAALLCTACSHVLNPESVPNHWQCCSPTCRGSHYINAGDCGLCGVCGSRKPAGHG